MTDFDYNKINFNWIHIENFLSIGDPLFFDFKKHWGMNYVFGYNTDTKEITKNGVGKSTIFIDAILFGLFGLTSKKINKPNVLNRTRNKDCIIKICFTIGEDEYVIENGVKPTFCNLFCNGKDITKSSIKETQDYICTEVIKTTYTIFKNSILLSVNDTTAIFQMTKAEKRDFIESIFNLSIYGKMFKNVKEDLNTLEKELLVELNTYNKLENDIKEFEYKHASFEEDKRKQILEYTKDIQNIQSKINIIDFNIDENTVELNNINDELETILVKITNIKGAREKINTHITYIDKDIKVKETAVEKYKNILSKVCGNCACCDIIDTTISYTENQEAIKELLLKKDQYVTQYNRVNDGIIAYCDKADILKNDKKSIQNTINEKKDKQKEVDIFTHKIETLNAYINKLQNEISPFSDLIVKYMQSKTLSYSNITNLYDLKKYFQYLIYMLSEDGIKKMIVSSLINVLNTRIKKYLEELESDYTVIFDPNFEYKFFTITGECEYDSFSSGERMRLNHATLFAFKDLLCAQGTLSSSVLVCDELLDISIDNTASEALLNIIKRHAETQTVFVISHKEVISNSSEFDNIIELKKENGFTRIVSDSQQEFGEQI